MTTTRSMFVAASALLLGACVVTRTPDMAGETFAFQVPLDEPQVLVFADCEDGEVTVRLVQHQRCVNWAFQETLLGSVVATHWDPRGVGTTQTFDNRDEHSGLEEGFPARYEAPLEPERRAEVSGSASESACEAPVVGEEVRVGDVRATTDETGRASVRVDDPSSPTFVRWGDTVWVVECR